MCVFVGGQSESIVTSLMKRKNIGHIEKKGVIGSNECVCVYLDECISVARLTL